MKNYSDEVKEIHHAFNTAGDELLFKVKEIINTPRRNEILKAKRLREIGFKSAQQADILEEKELLKDGEISFEEAEQLHYYQIHYPLNKFITQNQVESICEKYNLFYGDICRYKGFVPEKNLLEMEMFRIDGKDVGLEDVSVRTERIYNDVGVLEPWYMKIKDNGEKAKDRFLTGYKLGQVKAGKKICAPLKDMNLEKFTWVKLFDEEVELPVIDEKDMFQKEALKIVPDPVVLQPVRYGFLIVTAWGDEASDEMVVNPRNN